MPITHLLASAALYAAEKKILPKVYQKAEETQIIGPVIIDTDGTPQDAWALLMALQAHKSRTVPFSINAITCVNGTECVKNVARTVMRILETEHVKVPVFMGAESALVAPIDNPEECYDSFKAHLLDLDPQVEKAHAVTAIIDLALRHKGKLRILALGPLTNLALALKLKPEIVNHIAQIFVLGGNVEGSSGGTDCPEFNFVGDPEAAHLVLTSFPCPIYVLPWETTLKASMPNSWRVNCLGVFETEAVRMMNKIEANRLECYKDESWLNSDGLAAAAFIDPKVIRKRKKYSCAVELGGSHTRGMLVVDRISVTENPPNVIIISEVNVPLYEKMLVWAVGGPLYELE